MGKLKDLASVKSTNASSFAYLPPDSAFDAMRILVKADLKRVSSGVLGAVLRGLRRASPMGRIVVIDAVSPDKEAQVEFEKLGVMSLLDREMRITDTDNLIMHEYPNRLIESLNYSSMTASEYIKDYDCVISLSAFVKEDDENAQILATLGNLIGIFPQRKYQQAFEQIKIDDLLTDIYFTIGQYIDGAVLDHSQAIGKVIWGDDLLAVDEVACQLAEEPVPDYIADIRQRRKAIVQAT